MVRSTLRGREDCPLRLLSTNLRLFVVLLSFLTILRFLVTRHPSIEAENRRHFIDQSVLTKVCMSVGCAYNEQLWKRPD